MPGFQVVDDSDIKATKVSSMVLRIIVSIWLYCMVMVLNPRSPLRWEDRMEGELLASRAQRPGMLLNILQCTARSSRIKK